MKRSISLFLALVLVLTCSLSALAGGLDAFQELLENPPVYPPFRDVPQSEWYYTDVGLGRTLGLINGRSETVFDPTGPVSLAEVVAMAVRAYDIYHGPSETPSPTESPIVSSSPLPSESSLPPSTPSPAPSPTPTGPIVISPQPSLSAAEPAEEPMEAPTGSAEPAEASAPAGTPEPTQTPEPTPSPTPEDRGAPVDTPWYVPYVEKALDYGLLPQQWTEYEKPASRAQTAEIFSRVLPDGELAVLNRVDSIPDVQPGHGNYEAILKLYRAGVLSGTNEYGSFAPGSTIKRSEVIATLVRLVLPERRKTFTLRPYFVYETIVFGKSGAGRDLVAHRYGDGKNVMIFTFATHGFEDAWARDGQELVWLAGELQTMVYNNYDLLRQRDWTVYIIPCFNPDGLYDGNTNNGPGRCTTYYIDANGNSVYGNGRGVDLNRCFEKGFKVMNTARNFTGSKPLSAVEAVAMKNFVLARKGEGRNLFFDVHGWTQQIITSSGVTGRVSAAFQKNFPQNSKTVLGGPGYLTAWTASQGFDSCLFEFPSNVYSHQGFVSKNYPTKFLNSVLTLLQTYPVR